MSLIEQLKHNEKPYALCANFRHCEYYVKPDYRPEPQTERCLVEPAVGGLRYRKTDWRGGHKYLHEALSDPDFMCFEYENGNQCTSPRNGYAGVGKPAPIPKWVLFKRSK